MTGGEHENTTGSKPGKQPKVLFDAEEEGIKADLPHVDGPKILFSSDESEKISDPRTSNQKRPVQPAIPFGASRPPTPKSKTPKVIGGGKIRKRMSCRVEDIQELDANISEADAERAIRIINEINLDDEYFQDVLRFGSELQVEHGAIAEAELAIANSEPLRKAQTYLASMLKLLTDLDPKKVFSVTKPSFGELFKKLAVPSQPPAQLFAEKYPQLLVLAQNMNALESALISTAESLIALNRRYIALNGSTASHILAAKFIVKYVIENPDIYGKQAHYMSQVNTLESRIASLFATRTTLEIGRMNNEALQATVSNLIESNRGMLDEDLPAFHNAYTTALVGAIQPKNSSNQTWLAQVLESHASFMQKLTGDKR